MNQSPTIDLTDPALRTGAVTVHRAFRGAPDTDGVLLRAPIQVPSFRQACYYAAYQKYDPVPESVGTWIDGANRFQPLRVDGFDDLKEGGVFLLLQLDGGDYLALLPLTGPRTVAWLASGPGGLELRAGTLGVAGIEGDVPLCAAVRDPDPYAACRRVWELAIPAVGESTRRREEKRYPDILRYLGWCSWEEYRFGIDEALLLDAVRRIEASDIPIRYVLVDDGHLDTGPESAEWKRMLHSFAPDAKKFPNGWGPLLAARRPDRVRWMGLWLNFNGYWNGVRPENRFGALGDRLEPSKKAGLVPRNGFLDSFAFYDAMIGAARDAGFDFVKVDNQAANLRHNVGLDNAAERAVNNQQALEAACARHMDGLINCMAHGPQCVFNTRVSAVTRCSEDYLVGDPARARRHLHNSYANIPWMGQTVWGDHDMFHSNDPASGRMMAVSKAVSGGPVYLSDDPARFDRRNIDPLCLADGLLLRPLAPAAPLPASLFADPFAEAAPYTAIAPLPNGAAVVVAYNLTEPVVPVSGQIAPDDYAHAAAMLPNAAPWTVPADGLLLYLWEAGRALRLDAPWAYDLPGFEDLLALLCPIHRGWAVVGRTDKYLAPAAVEVIDATDDELILRLPETGPFAVWSDRGAPALAGTAAVDAGNGLWRFDLPVGGNGGVLRIRR